jgi:peptide/nickel transport system permease protein
MGGLIQGDFGTSFLYGRPVSEILAVGVKRTFLLGLLAVIIGTVAAIPLGILGAVYKDTSVDAGTRFLSVSGISIPEFWLALLVIMIFSKFWHGWFGEPLIPATGYAQLSEGITPWFRHTIGPACVLAVPYTATISRITRAEMVDVLNEGYITAARARGVKEQTIVWIHAFRNALIPVLTVGAYQAGIIMNGSVLVETVFSYPGLGYYIYKAALSQDYNLLMGSTVVVVLVFITLNLLADLGYAWVDPRIDYEGASE